MFAKCFPFIQKVRYLGRHNWMPTEQPNSSEGAQRHLTRGRHVSSRMLLPTRPLISRHLIFKWMSDDYYSDAWHQTSTSVMRPAEAFSPERCDLRLPFLNSQQFTSNFHSELASLEFHSCTVCLEHSLNLVMSANSTMCTHCNRDNRLYSAANNMDPGPVPP